MSTGQPLPGLAATHKRAGELDALHANLQVDRRDQLAVLLTDEDVATLKHLARQGMGDNTLRALTSDLAYLEAWCLAATGAPLPWPAPEGLLLKFVAHHLWDCAERGGNPDHGMPEDVATALRVKGMLRSPGPHAPATERRRLTSWSTLMRWRRLVGSFSALSLKSAVRLANRANNRPRQRKSKKAVTGEILGKLLEACSGDRLVDLRDRTLLLMAFASGGRRRSEMAALRVEDLTDEDPVKAIPDDSASPLLPCLTIRLGRTKTTTSDDDEHVVLIGRPVVALRRWFDESQIEAGPVFRRIDQWGNIDRRALTPQSVNLILKSRVAQAGLEAGLFSARGVRSGYLTEAANQGIPLLEAMEQSRHKSLQQASAYYNSAGRRHSRAARLIA